MHFGNTIVEFDRDKGTLCSLRHSDDPMEWCAGPWGCLRMTTMSGDLGFEMMPLTECRITENGCFSAYRLRGLGVSVTRQVSPGGRIRERYEFRNERAADLFLRHGDVGILLPFQDKYTDADDCMRHRCHTHLWCGGSTAYVLALRMGVSAVNLGLVLTAGSVSTYSIQDAAAGDRGIFVFDCEAVHLHPDETFVLEWELFWTSDTDDFYRHTASFDSFLRMEAPHFTVFTGEPIKFSAILPATTQTVSMDCAGQVIPYTREGRTVHVRYEPKTLGAHRMEITYDGRRTFADFFVSERPETVIKKRVQFIVKNQQCHDSGSHLDGAYLIYDNQTGELYYDVSFYDHNACRERIGMALLIAKYLQSHPEDAAARQSLERYVVFLKREFYDENTGEVFNDIQRNNGYFRLYNAPWVAQLFTEMYFLTGEEWYLRQVKKIFDFFYQKGGERFYPNAIEIGLVMQAFQQSRLKAEGDALTDAFKRHVEHMVRLGRHYPKHEVNYEQTIVAPAVTFIAQMGRQTGDPAYTAAAKEHVETLKRFNGVQPSFHLHEIPIRYWDDYWFGKARIQGDTFPHYWSCLTARAFMDYYWISGNPAYRDSAIECMRNCFCLFDAAGHGSAAYVYPYRIGTKSGEFYDDWANDQDFALYFAMEFVL